MQYFVKLSYFEKVLRNGKNKILNELAQQAFLFFTSKPNFHQEQKQWFSS